MDLALEGTIDISREIAYRDRAIVVLLAGAGVRGAELFRDPRDDDRNGVTWGDIDLENHSLEVFGKSRQYERVGLPSAAQDALQRYRRIADPPIDDWPIFPTNHAPSKYAAYRDAVEEDPDADVAIDDALRSAQVPPPALTKAGGRSVMKRLTKEASINLENGEYLKPHGARRALGAELYEKGHSELAQSALRHKSIETTHESYSDIQAKDVADGIDEVRE
ncbi:tyrosine-type recombinase/integrase [Halostagnicola kamekurae]|uniref:tyrosine-type recombinase/integrase n=1 Tax=Halostagnicola kamekurae TaxID=619731 RepID=UPI001FE3DA5E|nr:site-specific integrase [Halostagnicola kamekurae]